MTEFLASMPAAYARAFDAAAVAEHAQIVARRGARLAHAEPCRAGGVCVVTDDRPGLLAMMTDALLAHGLGIRSAQAYCRQRADGRAEAVDFLELYEPTPRAKGAGPFDLDATVLGAFIQVLSDLIADDIRASARPSAPPAPARSRARAYFELAALRRNEYVLLVEAPDSEGLLHAISSALHAHGVRILACSIATEGGVARDRFELASLAGSPLTEAELCDVQLAVFDALPRRPA